MLVTHKVPKRQLTKATTWKLGGGKDIEERPRMYFTSRATKSCTVVFHLTEILIIVAILLQLINDRGKASLLTSACSQDCKYGHPISLALQIVYGGWGRPGDFPENDGTQGVYTAS